MNETSLPQALTTKQKIAQVVIAFISLTLAIYLLPSVSLEYPWSIFSAFIVIGLLQFIVTPFFTLIARYFGIIGLLLLSFFGNAFIVWLAFILLPGIQTTDLWSAFLCAWLYAIIITLANWVFVSQSNDMFLAFATRSVKRTNLHTDTSGFLFVQLDGVSAPVLDWQLKAGNLPNIARLIREEDYDFRSWHAQLPSTTPASQAGILLGKNDDIPAFRWYEKKTAELVVANQFQGAQLIERRLSTGDGLLANDGVSIGNLFSGDAKTNIMVMSKIDGDRESIRSLRSYDSYFYSTFGFMRSFILSLAEMAKEVYQARRQVSRDVQPRIDRHGSYILLRAMTNVLLRDLQTTLVIQNMMRGVSSIYVDYLDYDEIAHHAGVARSESLDALTGLDNVLGLLWRAKAFAPRAYEIIIVSDHGQSQGATFKQLHDGKNLEDFVLEFMNGNEKILSATDPVEQNSVKASLTNKETGQKTQDKPDVVVTGSGNLGNIWLNRYPRRADYDEIRHDYPKLIDNLMKLDGIGFIVVKKAKSYICLSSNGTFDLSSNKSSGVSPVAPYPAETATALLRLASMKNAPDIIVLSSCEEGSNEVHAFEELVGNHGGIGGWQREAILLHPHRFSVSKKFTTDGEIYGAENLHNILKTWLRAEQAPSKRAKK